MSLNAGNARQGITSDPALDERFKREFYEKQTNDFYQEMQRERQKLPVFKEAKAICESIEYSRHSQVTVISGETGCGKTTQVPQFILDDYITRGQGSRCRIVCTQPRRISAMSVAHRVAVERSERMGGADSTVGYQIRMESERPREKGSILYCTTGIVLKWMESDPLLKTVSHIILDEIHERDIHSEFLLVILKGILAQRPDLKLILMSATLNAEKFSRYYGGCPVFKIPGFLHPVEEHYLEDVVEMTSYRPSRTFRGRGGPHKTQFQSWLNSTSYSYQTKETLAAMYNNNMIDLDIIVSLIRIICLKEEGAILVFLTGWDQITQLLDKLLSHYYFQTDRFLILPLHGGMMSMEEQQQVFLTPSPGVRKIVLSTNVAETSITIDDVVYVIDCGKLKIKNYDARKNISTLDDHWNSVANSKQRRGRAGRVRAGHCYHLYTRHQKERLVEQHKPEMLRTRLGDLCLQIKLLRHEKIMDFFDQAMEKPAVDAIERSIRHLRNLKALDVYGELTPLGVQLARMPVDPHIGKMLLFAAIFGCLEPILSVAACLDHKVPFTTPPKKEAKLRADTMKRELAEGTCSDHLMFSNAIRGWQKAKVCGRSDLDSYLYKYFLSSDTLRELKKRREQFAQILNEIGFISTDQPSDRDANKNSSNTKLLRAVVCAGLYPNVGIIKTKRLLIPGLGQHYYTIDTGDEEVELHVKSVNCAQPIPFDYIVYFQKMKTKKLYIFDSTGISLNPLIYFGEDLKLSNMDSNRNIDVAVDSLVKFKTTVATAREIETLRRDLWEVLKKKFENPCPTDWADDENEGFVMNTFLEKITQDASVAISG
ncbi:ATP-dependent DNA/RNA helicase DHX36-like [Lineus longissimus]|uniref:ATP-dependent DNA/RNA helicase DHX36-like n=1 Tax=Lineus longissimus TaxID=88925 RepID=UPI00315C87D5